jgi:hypothetical protein
MTDTPKPRRRWLRYSLITLLVVVLLTSIAMSWFAHRLQKSMRQHEAVEAILVAGGGVKFDFEIDQSGNPLPEASPPGPAWLRHWVGDDIASNVVEAEVQTDAALEGIKDLPQLHQLHLFSQGITDAGLEHLEQLPQLETLYLENTQVTEQGVRKLQKALPNCQIAR